MHQVHPHSPKFFRKITYVTTLSDLAHHVPLTQIDIAPAVYQCVTSFAYFERTFNIAVCRENLKYEKKITLPVPTRSNIFGVPLDELMGYNGEKGGIPRVVKDCMQFLRERGTFLCYLPAFDLIQSTILGMMEEGLFRRSPQSVMLRAAQDAYDRGKFQCLQ
jgi:Rho GTPase-activating protein 1